MNVMCDAPPLLTPRQSVGPNRHRANDRPWLSVVVPTYRRPALLRRCLTTLCSQTMETWRYEIIVVVDGGSEDIRELITMLTASPGGPVIRYRATPDRRGPASARNLGWRSARGGMHRLHQR
ncbi:MAG: glycosyltransferase family 2 protein [Nitrospira sp.]